MISPSKKKEKRKKKKKTVTWWRIEILFDKLPINVPKA